MGINYGEKILNLRTALGLSQASMADKLGLKRYQISSIELNKNKPTLELITRVINIFRIKPDYFFFANAKIERYDGGIITHLDDHTSNINTFSKPNTPYGDEQTQIKFIKSLEDQIITKDLVIENQAEIISLLKEKK